MEGTQKEEDYPHTEAVAREVLSLLMYPDLTDEQIVTLCDVLLEVLG